MKQGVHFIKVTEPQSAAEALTQRLRQELSKDQRVLWLVPGGSNIPLSVQVMHALLPATQQRLAIMLTDERYGTLDHPDSNTRQLREAGFTPGEATVVPVLTPENLPLAETCARYEAAIRVAFDNADVVIGQFGMGADGHIAGVLPGSPAINSRNLVAGYDAGNFVRITLTPPAIKQISAAYLFAFGEAKREALINLQSKTLPLTQQPAQIIKSLPEAYVYNDQIGEDDG